MKFDVLAVTARSISLELDNKSLFFVHNKYNIFLDGKSYSENVDKNVFSFFGLEPNRAYVVCLKDQITLEQCEKTITTLNESVRLNVLKFGAKGDGVHLDSPALQAAILSCPSRGTVYLPKGTYYCGPLFLKSNITIELAKGAVIKGHADRALYPILPGYTTTSDESDEFYLGTWEGNPLDAHASLISGIDVSNVSIIGKGTIDGNGAGWWINPKEKKQAWRPRTIFLKGCKNVLVQGVRITNSPSWTIHPYLSSNLNFIDLEIENPDNSPNTDGLNPESCSDVCIIGVHFSVGDDCIAIKSGKLYMGRRLKRPSERIVIRNCHMLRGHGAVVIGSEMAGGVKNVEVSRCLFKNTDRGFRVKTRRGRGENAIVDNISFSNIKMDEVLTPFVINMFYFCDPDGESEYVYSKEKLPVDEWTPRLGKFVFKNIDCLKCEVAAAYFYGLPEQPVAEIDMEDVSIKFKEQVSFGKPAMMSFAEDVSRAGVFAKNVKKMRLHNVNVEGQAGRKIITADVDQLIED